MKNYLGNKNYPRGFRNNNPGNLIIRSTNNWLGKIAITKNTDKHFEQFISFEYGVRALIIDLINKYQRGLKTIQDIIMVYSPPSENDTMAYIKAVAAMTGISPNSVFEFTKANLQKLVKAIVKVENNYPLDDEDFESGFSLVDDKKKSLLKG